MHRLFIKKQTWYFISSPTNLCFYSKQLNCQWLKPCDKSVLPFPPTVFPCVSANLLAARERMITWSRFPFQAMVSFPGSLRSLKVCMLMTSSVFTIAGGWGLCLSLRWHFRDTCSSSTMALQKDRYREAKEKQNLLYKSGHMKTEVFKRCVKKKSCFDNFTM